MTKGDDEKTERTVEGAQMKIQTSAANFYIARDQRTLTLPPFVDSFGLKSLQAKNRRIENHMWKPSLCQILILTGVLMSAFLKWYLIGAAVGFFTVLFRVVNSVGGQMYIQNQQYYTLSHQTNRELLSQNQPRRSRVTRGFGS